MIPKLSLDQVVSAVTFADDPDRWVTSPPIYYPSVLVHHGFEIGYAVRYKVRHCNRRKEGVGPLPLRHLFIDYTSIEDVSDVPFFIEETILAFKMNDFSILKTEERCMHVFQKLFYGLPFED